jgi:hypothetical protein
MDTDGQHNPADIPALVKPIVDDTADMVNGSRYMDGNDENTPAYRRVGQTVLDTATSVNTGIDLTDSQSGFRAFRADTSGVFSFHCSNLAIESEMLAEAASANLRIQEVPIGVRYDVDCSSENPVKHGLGVLVRVLKDMEFHRPLYYFTLPGLVFGGVGLYLGLRSLQTFYHGGALHFGPTILMTVLMLVGTFMAFTGIMLDSMRRMMQRIR